MDDHENKVAQQFLNTVILFIHCEQLEGQTIEEFKAKCNLLELVNKCGGHCHIIDNKHWQTHWWVYKRNSVQMKNLLDTIAKMVKENGCYYNELLQKGGERNSREIKKNEDNLSQM